MHKYFMKLSLAGFFIAITVSCLVMSVPGDRNESVRRYEMVPSLAGENPGWIRDLNTFKYLEPNTTAPKNLLLYYRKLDKVRVTHYRNDVQLQNQRELGPSNIAGRCRAYLIDSEDSNHHFAGSVSGGLWESWDAGHSWTPQSDREENMSVSYIAQNPFNPDILYYCTGEAAGNSAGISGVGVFKSEDRGKHFRLLPGSEQNGLYSTWRIVCSPNDPNTLYVASRLGAYVSHDAGVSFRRFYFTECTDLAVLKDGSIFLAVIRQGIFRSTESSLNDWERLKFPSVGGAFNRIEIAYAPSDPQTMYAALARNGGNRDLLALLRSKDGGDSWKKIASPQIYTAQSWYNLVLQVHPRNPNIVVFGNVQMAVSYLGGFSWFRMKGSHSDRHLAYFDPHDPDHMIMCSDGGIDEYRFKNNKIIFEGNLKQGFNVTQYYAGDYFPNSNRVIGGAQDNGTTEGTDKNMEFNNVYGADGTYCAVAKDNPDIVLWGTQNGKIYLSRNFNKTRRSSFSIVSYFKGGRGGGDYFIAPFYMNRGRSNQLLLMKTSSAWFTGNLGKNWVALDSGLNRPYAGTFLEDDKGLHIFVGGRKARLLRYDSEDGGKSFSSSANLSVNLPSTLKDAFLRAVVVDPLDSQSLYVCFSTVSEYPRVWKVSGALGTHPVWSSVSGDLPQYLPVNDLAVSSINPKEMAAATDYGIYTTMDNGMHWVRDIRIPNVAVFQVKIRRKDNKLFAFTHGRGAWMADFPIYPVATKNISKLNAELFLFPNPVRHMFRIKMEGQSKASLGFLKYEMLNLKGEILQSGYLHNTGRPIDVSRLHAGTYILILYSANGKQNAIKHFVKM